MKKILFTFVFLGLALAQVNLSGKLHTTFGVRPASGAISGDSAALDLNLDYSLSDAELHAALRFGYDPLRGGAYYSLGEAYARVYLPQLDLSLGREVVSWGKVDLLSPLDVVNPRDLSSPLNPEKQAAAMLHAVFYPLADGDYQIELVWLPVFQPSTPPAGDWAPQPNLPPGVTQVRRELPKSNLQNGVFGLRASASADVLDGLDLAAEVVRGYFPFPSPEGVEPVDPAQPAGPFRLLLGYDRYTLFGGDFALAFSIPGVAEGLVLRGEAAYALTADAGGGDHYEQNPYASGVLGLEYTWADGPTTILVYDLKWQKADSPAPDTLSQRLGLLARYDYNERLGLQGAWLHNLSDGSGVVRSSASYTFADGVKGQLAGAFLYGADGTQFGVWRNNSSLQVSLDYSF